MALEPVVIRGKPQLRGLLEAIKAELERSDETLEEVELTQGSTTICLTCFDEGNPCSSSQRVVLIDGTVSPYEEPGSSQ